MIKLWDDIRNEGIAEGEALGLTKGRAEGEALGRRNDIINMLTNGKKPEDISNFCGYDLSYVLEIENSILQNK